jgi:transcriptional regulator with XRE-family HTH domain
MKTSYHERDHTFGQAILTLRTAIGLTQGRLGSLLGVTARAVAGWEGGSNYPKTKHLKALIELAVQHQAFPKDAVAEEIRRLWKAAGQKVFLDEDWLSALLSQQSCQPSDVEPEAVEATRSSAPSPLPNGGAGPDRGFQTADPSGGGLRTAATCPCPPPFGDGSPYPSQEISITPDPTQAEMSLHRRDGADLWHEAPDQHEASDQHEAPDRGKPCPPLYKTRERRKWLLLSLIALVILIIVGSVGTLFFHVRDGATTQANKTQAYPGYLSEKGTLAFFDPLSQEGGSKWNSYIANSTGGACQFIRGAYHASQQPNSYFRWCPTQGTFSNFAFEVQLTIMQGDCGGMTFRNDYNWHFYFFHICQNGTYKVIKYMRNSGYDLKYLQDSGSSAMKTGLGQQNKIAIVANGSTMTFYVNEQQIDQEQDSSYTSGTIALIASSIYPGAHATDVAYSNASLWIL